MQGFFSVVPARIELASKIQEILVLSIKLWDVSIISNIQSCYTLLLHTLNFSVLQLITNLTLYSLLTIFQSNQYWNLQETPILSIELRDHRTTGIRVLTRPNDRLRRTKITILFKAPILYPCGSLLCYNLVSSQLKSTSLWAFTISLSSFVFG